jgi:Na+-driven multidrug efflux pump
VNAAASSSLSLRSELADTLRLGVKILMVVALFQIADGTQVSTTRALHGLGNTRAAMLAHLIGHYPIGLALGLVLCFAFRLGVVGFWAGAQGGAGVKIPLDRSQLQAEGQDIRCVPQGIEENYGKG